MSSRRRGRSGRTIDADDWLPGLRLSRTLPVFDWINYKLFNLWPKFLMIDRKFAINFYSL